MERTHWDNGVHKLEFEPPDIFHVFVNGPIALDEIKLTTRLQTEIAEKIGDLYLITYLNAGLNSFSPEVRKYFASVKPCWRATAIVGGNTVARAAVNMGMRAMNVLSGSRLPTRMVGTVGEAYAWIAELRAARKSEP